MTTVHRWLHKRYQLSWQPTVDDLLTVLQLTFSLTPDELQLACGKTLWGIVIENEWRCKGISLSRLKSNVQKTCIAHGYIISYLFYGYLGREESSTGVSVVRTLLRTDDDICLIGKDNKLFHLWVGCWWWWYFQLWAFYTDVTSIKTFGA